MLFTGTDVFWKPASLPPCTAARRQTRSDQSPEPGAAQQACCAPTAPPRGRAKLRAAPPPWAPDQRLDKGAFALLCLLRGLCVAFMSAVDRVRRSTVKANGCEGRDWPVACVAGMPPRGWRVRARESSSGSRTAGGAARRGSVWFPPVVFSPGSRRRRAAAGTDRRGTRAHCAGRSFWLSS